MCLTALHLAQPQYAWVVVPVELEEIMEKVILECGTYVYCEQLECV